MIAGIIIKLFIKNITKKIKKINKEEKNKLKQLCNEIPVFKYIIYINWKKIAKILINNNY